MLRDAESLLVAVGEIEARVWEGGPIGGADGWEHLLILHDLTQNAAMECIGALPSGEWLTHVRSMGPADLEPLSLVDSTPLLVRSLLTSLTAQSTTPPSLTRAIESEGIRWRSQDSANVERLGAITEAARLMRGIQSACRWVGKGAVLHRGRRSDAWYTIHVAEKVRRRVREFDRKAGYGLLGSLGSTANEQLIDVPTAIADPFCVAVVFEQPNFRQKPIRVKRDGEVAGSSFTALCDVRFGSLKGYLDQAVASGGDPRPEMELRAFGCLVLLRLLLALPAREGLRSGSPARNVVHHSQTKGFHAAPADWLGVEMSWVMGSLRRALEQFGIDCPVVDSASLIELLASIPATTFPATAPPIRKLDGGWVAVDFVSASRQLSDHLSRPPIEGAAANLWSKPFEDQLQAIIDSTPWSPGADIREMRGRRLRLKGEALTDIDALGVRDAHLLIVDAKARSPRGGLWRGEHAAIRLDDEHAKKSLSNWSRVVKTLRANPIGDNYDLSGFASIEGSVCYPYPVFTLAPQSAVRLRYARLGMLTTPSELGEALGGL